MTSVASALSSNLPQEPTASLLAKAIAAAKAGHADLTQELLAQVEDRATQRALLASETALVQHIRERLLKARGVAARDPLTKVPTKLAPALPGVCAVTCCMNRTENLLKALPTWLAIEEIAEIIIVDWSSDEPVRDSLAAAGLNDPRITIVRADGEPRWVLSFAFNLGFRMARHEAVIKIDADITLKPDFLAKNPLIKGTFVAGSWEVAAKGQEHINGFFYVRRDDLVGISGFNEHLTTYGWDDDDIYARLVGSGLKRVCVDTESIYHIPHEDSLRLGGVGGNDNARSQLLGNTLFNIRRNRFITYVMPAWNKDRLFAPFDVKHQQAGYLEVERIVRGMPHVVGPDVFETAGYFAALELISWKVGPKVYQLPRNAFYRLIDIKRTTEISPFDIDVCSIPDFDLSVVKRHGCLVQIDAATLPSPEQQTAFGALLQQQLAALGDDVTVYVYRNGAPVDAQVAARIHPKAVVIPRWVYVKGLIELAPEAFPQLGEQITTCAGVHILLTANYAQTVLAQAAPAAPAVVARKARLYIDAQHGLGNRMRAIGSAAAIAAAEDRELVILWNPDHHCDCKFSDLFDYTGPVIESRDEIPNLSSLRQYNYMDLEEGSKKDELIACPAGVDVIARAAFTLKHPASHWADENRFLHKLVPNEQVRALLSHLPERFEISAHVRMEAGQGLDHNTYDSPENWSKESHEALHHWRAKSHHSAFTRRIDALLERKPTTQLFLATDLPENYTLFVERYGDLVHYIPRNVWDRSREQIIYALADAIALGRGELLLGSTWSSFSELAMRISTTMKKTEMSGVDF